jgi:Ca-activated chloride channel family protein
MHGFPLDTAKTLLRELIGNLRPSDTFNVLLFSGSNRLSAPTRCPPPGQYRTGHPHHRQARWWRQHRADSRLKRVYAEPKAPMCRAPWWW